MENEIKKTIKDNLNVDPSIKLSGDYLLKIRTKFFYIIAAVVVVAIIMIISFNSKDMPREEKVYRDDTYGFELKYPYIFKKSENKVVFTGPKKSSEIFRINYYPTENIESVISKVKGTFNPDKDPIIFERDVKINTCTLRKITTKSSAGDNQNYSFIPLKGGTVVFSWRDPKLEESKDGETIASSLTCR